MVKSVRITHTVTGSVVVPFRAYQTRDIDKIRAIEESQDLSVALEFFTYAENIEHQITVVEVDNI